MVDGYQSQALRSRLGIPLLYGVDAVHGHNNVQGATLFPHHIGMGATRDAALVQQEGVIRPEVLGTGIRWAFARASASRGTTAGAALRGLRRGSVDRRRRWPRPPSGASRVPRSAPTSVLATAKHYLGDGGTSSGTGDSGYLIDRATRRLSEAALRAIHLPPFQNAIDAGVGSVTVSTAAGTARRSTATGT